MTSPIEKMIDSVVWCGTCGTKGVGNCQCYDNNPNAHRDLKSVKWRRNHPDSNSVKGDNLPKALFEGRLPVETTERRHNRYKAARLVREYNRLKALKVKRSNRNAE